MKRFLTALLAVLYLSLASGVTVHAHYCMGKLIGASLAHAGVEESGEHACGLCGMTKDSGDGGCCHDEEASFKISEAQKGAVQASTPVLFVADVPAPLSYGVAEHSLHTRIATGNHWANAPPPRPPAVPIFVRVCSFRI